MMELSRLSWKYLWNNKTKTIFTLIGICLSIFLMSLLLLFQNSYALFQNEMMAYISGGYQLRYHQEEKEKVFDIVGTEQIKEQVELVHLGYSPINKQSYIEILSIKEPSDASILSLMEGTYPKENEVLISKEYQKQNKIELGDELQLPLTNFGQTLETLSFSDETPTTIKLKVSGVYEPKIQINDAVRVDQMVTCGTYGHENLSLNEGYLFLNSMSKPTLYSIKEKLYDAKLSYLVNEEGIKLLFQEQKQISLPLLILVFLLAIFFIRMIRHIFIISCKDKIRDLGMLSSMGLSLTQRYLMMLIECCYYFLLSFPLAFLCAWLCGLGLVSMINTNYVTGAIQMRLTLSPWLVLSVAMFQFVFLFLANASAYYQMNAYSIIQMIKKDSKQPTIKHKNKTIKNIERLLGKRYRNYDQKGTRSIRSSFILSMVLILTSAYVCMEIRQEIAQEQSYEMVWFPRIHSYEDLETIETDIQKLKQLETVSNTELLMYFDGVNLRIPVSALSLEAQEVFQSHMTSVRMNIKGASEASSVALVQNNFIYENEEGERIVSLFEPNTTVLEINNEKDWKRKETLKLPIDTTAKSEEELPIINEYELENVTIDVYFSLELLKQYWTQIMSDERSSIELTLQCYSDDLSSLEQDIAKIQQQSTLTWKWDGYERKDQTTPIQILLFGLGGIVMLVATFHMICIVLSSIMLKKRSYQILQSIGLERKQLLQILFIDVGMLPIQSLALSLPLSFLMMKVVHSIFFSKRMFMIEPFSLFVVILIMISLCLFNVWLGYSHITKEIEITQLKS